MVEIMEVTNFLLQGHIMWFEMVVVLLLVDRICEKIYKGGKNV